MQAKLPIYLALGLSLTPAAMAQPTGYPTYDQMVAQMGAAEAAHPAICQRVNLTQKYGLAKTWQGKDMYAVKISDNVAQEEDEQAFLMVSNHHGNERGTVIIGLRAIGRFTEGYASDPQIKAIVDSTEIWIMPTCNPDGYWTSRENRNPTRSVDLNRNYPFLWSSPCNNGNKGSGPGSEPEVKTVMALSEDQRFTKVIDFHTYGRESLYGYYQRGCPNHQLVNYLRAEAIAVSQASSYGGQVRGPSSNGEHYQWQLGNFSNYAFLTETNTTHSPSITSANNEETRIWPGTLFILERPIPVWGHVVDARTGQPIEVNISYVENPFTQGERNRSEPGFGRYHAWLPQGTHTIRFSHPCYMTQDIQVNVTATSTQLDVQMEPACAECAMYNGSGINPTGFDCATLPVLGTNWDSTIPTVGSTLSTQLGLSTTAAQMPLLGGELLIGMGPELVFQAAMGSHTIGVPNDNSLLGALIYAQGFRVDSAGAGATLVLFNGRAVTLGIKP